MCEEIQQLRNIIDSAQMAIAETHSDLHSKVMAISSELSAIDDVATSNTEIGSSTITSHGFNINDDLIMTYEDGRKIVIPADTWGEIFDNIYLR